MHRSMLRFALLALVLAFSGIAIAARAASPPLVDVAWLRQHLNDPGLVILDVHDNADRTEFAAGHIPGALFTDFEHDGWLTKIGSAPGMLPRPA